MNKINEIPQSAIKTMAYAMGAMHGTNWNNCDGGWEKEAKQYLQYILPAFSMPSNLITVTTKLHKKRYRGFGRRPCLYITLMTCGT